MTTKLPWLEASKEGLAKVLERRHGGKAFAVLELVQNCWDEDATICDITIRRDKRGYVRLIVEDDDPDGFVDLTHAYTLFAESTKKDNPEKRGRFNIGEKFVLAICEAATIQTTTGTVVFDPDGRTIHDPVRDRGSKFDGLLRMNKAEYDASLAALRTLIPPATMVTRINGEVLEYRSPLREFEATLPTEKADADGYLRPTARKTKVLVYEPLPGEKASIYEMGIPVVETGDKYHYSIEQKIPLNTDRDNVRPAFLKQVRTLVLNEMVDRLSGDDVTAAWVTQALESKDVAPDAVKTVVTKRFGEKVVKFDPSDVESSRKAAAEGYVVVYGRTFNTDQWDNIKAAQAILPAGQVTPSSTKLFNEQRGESAKPPLDPSVWTPEMRGVAEFARFVAERLLDVPNLQVTIVNDSAIQAAAYYNALLGLTLNVGRLGKRFFVPGSPRVVAVVLHELAHHHGYDHLDERFADEIARLGALLVEQVAADPTIVSESRWMGVSV